MNTYIYVYLASAASAGVAAINNSDWGYWLAIAACMVSLAMSEWRIKQRDDQIAFLESVRFIQHVTVSTDARDVARGIDRAVRDIRSARRGGQS